MSAIESTQDAVSLLDVQKALDRIRPFVHKTPVITSSTIDKLAPQGCGRVFMKCENLQKVGAFKFRGATNAILSLIASPSESADSSLPLAVVTHSSGNHAQALALAAREQSLRAHIIMPSNAPSVKQDAVRGYGAAVTLCEPTLEARETTAAAAMKQEAAEGRRVEFIAPYDDVRVIAGQGTMALELLDQAKELLADSNGELDILITPVGGGGMLSGCALAAKGTDPDIKVFGAEPLGVDDAQKSFRSKKFVPAGPPNTIADGLLTSLGDITFPLILKYVDDVFTVTEDQIIAALKLSFERLKMVIEPSAAVSLAVVLFSSEFASFVAKLSAEKGRLLNVGIVFSGGNVELAKVLSLLTSSRST
ncbi:serine racemase [Clavulina sp. PMI_390]|nr:serine racemase [Clavulina sp. PMI_390]